MAQSPPRSGRRDYETPPLFMPILEELIGFKPSLDAAATADTAKCPHFYGPGSKEASDCLNVATWRTPWFLNPPFGAPPKGSEGPHGEEFICVAACQASPGVMLLPSNCQDAEWWHRWVLARAHRVIVSRGRLPFLLDGKLPRDGDGKAQGPGFGIALCVYLPGHPPANGPVFSSFDVRDVARQVRSTYAATRRA